MTLALEPAQRSSRSLLLAVLGAAGSAVVTAIGTFWALNDSDDRGASGWYVSLVVIAVATVLVQGLVVRTAGPSAGRRGVVLGVLALLAGFVFWTGLPMPLAAGAAACSLVERDKHGAHTAVSATGLTLAVISAFRAVVMAFIG